MGKFFEKVLDILYDYIDLLVMAGIIVIIVFTIGWRLDVLFEKNTKDMYQAVGQEESPKEKEKPAKKDDSENKDQDPDKNEDEDKDQDNEEDPSKKDEEPSKPSGRVIVVEIPYGSVSTQVGEVLYNKGIVESASEFVKKAQDLELDRKLQSGKFEIPEGSSLEDIVKIVAKQK